MMARTRGRVTSKEVADLAGVSQSAVSRVYTKGASVSAKTRARVHHAAQQLGYRPDPLARTLVTGRSRMIGIVVGYLDNQFYPDAIQRLTQQLQVCGYHALIFMSAQEIDNSDKTLTEILDYKVDGLVIASASMSSCLAQRCQQEGIPVVLFNRSQDDDRLSAVTSDNYSGGKKVADHLVESGFAKMAYIAGREDTATQRDREAGFISGLVRHGYALHSRAVGQFTRDGATEAALYLFGPQRRTHDRPDAVFVANDHMALAVMDAVRFTCGLSIPQDVAVVGYDDVPMASWPSYQLTTVRQPINQMVRETVTLLLTAIECGNSTAHEDFKPRRLSIDGPLQIRHTTTRTIS